MRIVALAMVVALGCVGSSHDGAMLEPGDYRLVLITDNTFSPHPMYLALEPDGSYEGQHDLFSGLCRGTLSDDEMERLTRALERADALHRAGGVTRCIDCGTRRVTLEVVRGHHAGARSSFQWDGDAEYDDAALRELHLAIVSILEARWAVDDCMGCPWSPFPSTTCSEEAGALRVCEGTLERTCAAAHGGDIVSCSLPRREELECVPDDGWLPPIVWHAEEAELRRGMLEDGTPVGALYLRMTVVHHGFEGVPLTPAMWWRLEDPTDLSELSHAPSGALLTVPGGALLDVWFVETTVDPDSALLVADQLQLRLRERPTAAAPFGDPIPVTIADSP